MVWTYKKFAYLLLLLLIPVDDPMYANDCGLFICCVVYAIFISYCTDHNRDFLYIDETKTHLTDNGIMRNAFPWMTNSIGFDNMNSRCHVFWTNFMQLCFKIGYGYSQSPTCTTTTSLTTTSSPSNGGRHNDKEKREDCENVSSNDSHLYESESEIESEINI